MRFERGFQRSAREVADNLEILLKLFVIGIVFTAIAEALASAGIPSPIDFHSIYLLIVIVVEFGGIISTALIINKMPHWGTLYMIGWIVGFLFFWYIGLATFSDLMIYTVPSLIFLFIRGYDDFGYYSGGFLSGL